MLLTSSTLLYLLKIIFSYNACKFTKLDNISPCHNVVVLKDKLVKERCIFFLNLNTDAIIKICKL